MSFPKVSIITVVYNAKEALAGTLESIKSIQYPNKEIVIVDGGSSDGTKEVIEKNYLDIAVWISERDDGIYDAMNKALRLATGDYVWFVNAGDKVYDSFILEHIFKGKECFADLYYGDTLVTAPDGRILGLRRKKPSRVLKWTSFKKGMTVCHQSIIVRRSIAPFYDVTYRFSADFDWVIKILKSGATVHNTRRIIAVFEEGGATARNRIKSLKERFRIMVKYYGLPVTLFNHFMFCFKIFKPKFRAYTGKRR